MATEEEHTQRVTEMMFKGVFAANYFTEEGEFKPTDLSAFIRKSYRILTMRDNLDIYIYDNTKGYYQPNGYQFLRELIKDILSERYGEAHAKATINDITASTGANRAELEPPLNLIPLKNGILDLSKNPPEFMHHSPDYFFTSTLPIEYYPNAQCPKILKFIEDLQPDKIEQMRLQEHVGYLLYRKQNYQIAMLLVGPEDSGKSRFLELLRRYLGEENVSSVDLHDFVDDRFARAELYHKYANICADISKTTLRQTGIFKRLTGGDLIDAQKKHRDPFRFVNSAKLWFSANEIPETADKTNAFFKRWDYLEFSRQFTAIDRNPNIIEEISTPEELSGFLNWALEGLQRLLKNRKFTNIKTLEQRKEIWLLGSSSLYRFVKDCVEEADWSETKEDFYIAYTRYCGGKGLSTLDIRVVGRDLPRIIPSVRRGWHREGDKEVQCWRGIKIVGENSENN
jgi:putative DNA primase/helicase